MAKDKSKLQLDDLEQVAGGMSFIGAEERRVAAMNLRRREILERKISVLEKQIESGEYMGKMLTDGLSILDRWKQELSTIA